MVGSGAVHPLSAAQEQLWFIDQLRSGAAVEYLLPATLRLRGPLDRAALIAALTRVADRHAVLRSRFDTVDGAAVRIVTDPAPVEMSVVDFAAVPAAEREARLREIRLRDLRTPIDLRTQPPWRITLVRMADDDAVLLIVVHHIVFDGMSWSVLARELRAFYGATTGDAPVPLPEVHDIQARQETGPGGDGLAYWTDRLAGLVLLELPTDRARPAQWVADGDSVDLVVPPDLARGLAELGRAHRATPFMVHLAAYQLLLARYSRQDDVAIGVSVSTRRPDELPLIGMFLNTVVLRGDLSGQPSFADLLARARTTALEAYAHQDVPFDRVIAHLAPERDPSRNPVFQAGIAWYDARRSPYELPGLDVTLCPPLWASSAFDLSLHLAQFADGSVHGQLIYPTSLFDRARIERMAANYVRLLTELAAAPDAQAHAVELVAESEQDRLRSLGTATAEAAGPSLPELFFATAARSPRAVAVVSDVDELDYGELAARVDALAGHLRGLGVGTETPVGVAMDRGTDLAVALLAILTAGATYVPLPPDHPAERLRHIVDDTGIALVLSHTTVDIRLPDSPTRVNLDEHRDTIARGSLDARPAIHGAQTAYVVHTSGSTGTPKGVAVTHDGIRNRVLWSVRNQLTATDRVLHKTTIGFDASLWELLTPLIAGATLIMAPPGAHRDPAAMTGAITRHRATVLQLVPSVLRLLLDQPEFGECVSLRLICSAGEALPVPLCARLTALLEVEIDNTYGPTECAIDATAWRYRPGEHADTVPIGVPLSTTRVFVVDAEDRLVPIGVPGELCVSGAGLARGYVGRPGQTARQFTPHPYPRVPGERWYRTGDLVRWQDRGDGEAGALEFLGRVDHQVKINGVRIEPGEIEAALCTHPDVTVAAVVPHRTPAGDTTLVSYAVSANGTTPADLHKHLATRLPAPMIPAAIHLVDALPLGPNGKLDRAALPGTVAATADVTAERTAPRTTTEQRVAAAMAELLGTEHVGAGDDFFALGGHSLLAIRLVLRLRREFGGELTIGELFDDRTVERLAARLDAGPATGSANSAIRPVPRDGDLPLSFAQQRMWFLDRLDPGSVEYLIPLALRLSGPLSVEAFQRAVDRLAARHEVLRTRYVDRGGEPVQVIDPPGPVAFRLVDLAGRPAAARELLDRVSSRPFDLAREHPLRVTVIRVAADEHLVALTLHHIAFDAWSMDILFRDLNDDRGEPLPVQYADFAAWQRSPESTAELAGQLRYWRHRLAGLTPVELTTDRPRPAQRDPRGDAVSVTVPAPVARAVTDLAARAGATPFMALLAAFQVLLGRYTGRTDVSVGTPVAGRTRQETEELLGLFTNTLVLRADVADGQTFTELLDQVRRDCTDAFANQDVPFEHLVDALQPDRDLSRNPLFQIMFEAEHLQHRPDTLCGTSVEPVRSGTPVAKFDLTVSVQQRDGGELRCVFEYATSLFDRTTVERMAGHYLNLLASAGADPDRGLAELDVLGADERRQLLHDWPDPDRDRLAALDPVDEHRMCLPELVERQAVLRPGAVAVVFGTRQLTYAELNARAEEFARLLLARGVGPETVVGVCLERSLDAVVVWLAVLRSGGVYVPFDPRHPAERLAFMLTDAGARVVVTVREFVDRFGDREVVAVDDDWAQPSDGDMLPRLDPRALAYVIYTSGSTGRPKGVMIEHRSYAHHCRVIADAYTIGPDDRVVLLSALTFDVAMDQIGATLLTGATVVVSDPVFWTPAELPARLAEYGVTIIDTTPAYYREAMRHDPELLAGLRLMNVGADVVTVDDARRWAAVGLPGRFLCSYGPTEATICSLLHPATGDLDGQGGGAAMPLGRPVAGTRAYVVDADLRPVPTGVPGELCLGGVRLARGYHERAALTAERFVPDPFGPPGARLYRTGDLVRYRQDGTIEFLGRIDHQVKIRGLRIELGEIEAALVRHENVDAAVVVTMPAPAGDPLLAAYVVTGPGVDAEALREHLRALLPDYMVPARWAALAALPMTASGKVDRKALPAEALTTRETGPAAAPRNPTEQLIADLWGEVLGVEQVGITDDFFALGGHSLLATRVLAGLRRTFGVELPLRRLFEATTVVKLADAVTRAVEDEIAGLSDAEVAELLSSEAS